MDSRILALLSALCFGVNPIVLKGGLKQGESDVGVFIGLMAGLPTMVLLGPSLDGFRFDGLTPLAAFYFALGGVFGVLLGRSMLYLGIQRLGSSRASTFKNSAPVVTSVLALLFLHELVSAQRWTGIGAVTVGLALVGNKARQEAGRVNASGIVIGLLSAVFYGIRPLFSKLGLDIAPLPFAATFISYLTAFGVYLVYFLARGQMGTVFRAHRRSVVFFAISGMLQVFGLLFLNYALNQDDVSAVYPISASAPLITFFLSYTVLKNIERLTLSDFVGTASAVTGVALLLI